MENTEKTTQHDEAILHFCQQLDHQINEDLIKANCKTTQDGLFINEKILTELVSAYRKYRESLTGKHYEKDDAHIIVKIFGVEIPSPVYLIEGKNAAVGFLVPVISRINCIPNFVGKTLSAIDYLHPRDPIFSEIDGLKTETNTAGLNYKLTTGKYSYIFSAEILKEFSLIAGSKNIKAIYPTADSSLRNSLIALCGILKHLKAAKFRQLFVPKQFRGNKEVKFLSWKNLIIVIKCEQIIDLYSTRGKSLARRILAEATQPGIFRSIEQFQAFQNSRNIGTFKMPARSFELSAGALCDFIEDLNHHPAPLIEKQFTVVDAIKSLCKLLETADNADTRRLAPEFCEKLRKDFAYYEKLDWLFLVLKKHTILGIYAKHKFRS